MVQFLNLFDHLFFLEHLQELIFFERCEGRIVPAPSPSPSSRRDLLFPYKVWGKGLDIHCIVLLISCLKFKAY